MGDIAFSFAFVGLKSFGSYTAGSAAVDSIVRSNRMYAEISAAIQSAKALSELVRALHGLANYNEFVTAVYEVNTRPRN